MGESAGAAGAGAAAGGDTNAGAGSSNGTGGTAGDPGAGTGGVVSGSGGSGGNGGASGGSAGTVGPGECTVVAPTACPDPAPTYANVEPIFSNNCVPCHRGSPDGPWPLTNYGHVASWRDEIRAMLLTCSMPPPEEMIPLPNDEAGVILNWIRCGMPP